jgi:hypothetical protein
MKRSTITLSDDLAAGVQAYSESQEVEPTHTTVVQAALREYLSRRGAYPPKKPLRITPAPKRSGRRDVSRRHDEHLASS